MGEFGEWCKSLARFPGDPGTIVHSRAATYLSLLELVITISAVSCLTLTPTNCLQRQPRSRLQTPSSTATFGGAAVVPASMTVAAVDDGGDMEDSFAADFLASIADTDSGEDSSDNVIGGGKSRLYKEEVSNASALDNVAGEERGKEATQNICKTDLGDALEPFDLSDVLSESVLHSMPSTTAVHATKNHERAANLFDVGYWRALCPWLHVEDPVLRKQFEAAELTPSADLVDECRDRMQADGYWNINQADFDAETGAKHLDWAVSLADLARGVTTLTAHGWPANFLLVYDEAWLLVHQLKTLVLLTSGNRLSFDFAIFHIVPGARGWPPHRDRGNSGTEHAFRPDQTPQYCTTWIALTDATPTNSCLHVVPKKHDPGYLVGEPAGASPMAAILAHGGDAALQHIRSLPCAAGSVIHFSHRLLHWGSSAESGPAATWRAVPEAPRIALSFSSTDKAFEKPFMDTSMLPSPPAAARLALVTALALFYVANDPPSAFRRQLYWAMAQGGESYFEPEFFKIVSTNFHAAAAGALD